MLRSVVLTVGVVAGVWMGTREPAHASAMPMCSIVPPPPRDGYDPTRIVREADMVVLARADSQTDTRIFPNGRKGLGTVHFTVSAVVGTSTVATPTHLSFPGVLTEVAEFNEGPVPYRWVRGSGLTGGCVTFQYQTGGQFLLLLRGATADSLQPYWAPLSPTNEQVRGADDPWVQWVQRVRGAKR